MEVIMFLGGIFSGLVIAGIVFKDMVSEIEMLRLENDALSKAGRYKGATK